LLLQKQSIVSSFKLGNIKEEENSDGM